MCWAEGKMSSASGPWGCRFLLNLFNRDSNLNKRKEYLKICMMPWFPIKDRGVVGMNCRQGQQHCIIFLGIFWLQLKHVSGFLLLFGGFFLHRTHKAERIWPLPSSLHSFPRVPCLLFTLHHSVFLSVLPLARADSKGRTSAQAVSSTWKASCAASCSTQLPPSSLHPHRTLFLAPCGSLLWHLPISCEFMRLGTLFLLTVVICLAHCRHPDSCWTTERRTPTLSLSVPDCCRLNKTNLTF